MKPVPRWDGEIPKEKMFHVKQSSKEAASERDSLFSKTGEPA
jgi:hypothetical protein